MKEIIILGSTGSIGTQTIEIVERNPDKFRINGLTAKKNWKLLAEQAVKLKPQKVAIADEDHYNNLKNAISGTGTEVLAGASGIAEVAAADADMVVVALVGISGLIPTIEAVKSGKDIALANKEALVVGGEIVMSLAKRLGVKIIPVDSEHSAIFQCLNGEKKENLKNIILTSSGGPFRNLPIEELYRKTAADALKHPNWDMGRKVTIDSSTLMNKGFEMIEARWLFDVAPENIEIIIHPQSIIHSMVEYIDGSIIAQMSLPNMRIPIQYALTYPERIPADFVNTDFVKIASLTFEEPRFDAFSCLRYAYDAIKAGGAMPAVLNGANEVAVELFLDGKIGFMNIPQTILKVMSSFKNINNPDLEALLHADKYSRNMAYEINKIDISK